MGQSKAGLQLESKSLLEFTLQQLQQAGCSPLGVAANRRHPLPYLFNNKYNIKITFDNELYSGPLAGLHSGLGYLKAWSEWAVVVPCDLPRLTVQALTSLIHCAFEGPKTCPTVIRQVGRVNPLLGVFPTAWHHKAGHLLESGLPRADGLIQGETLRYFDVPEEDWVWRDCDTPEEWQALQSSNKLPGSQVGKPV